DGEKNVTLKGDNIAEEFQAIVEGYVRRHYAGEHVELIKAPQAKTIPLKAI
ncbi:MAG TPA: 4-hydroxy-3-methylbut-2-en-1-yl diphosphate synthase, partial [Methylophilaceae bacterium]|nr:4-hydroxy-3-methylbut-2-en-1-yl diphosphate synthase [Methylophilaceae bacterium]